MNEQPLNLKTSLQEIWRHRFFIALVAVVCALGGIAFGILRPPDRTAVALVLLPSSGTSNSGMPNVQTDTVIATSTPVLSAAGSKLSPPEGAATLRPLVKVNSLGQQVLQIQAQATDGTHAIQLANAVATSYMKYLGHLRQTSEMGVAALQQESALLSQQVQDLQNQITPLFVRIGSEGTGSIAGQRESTLLESIKSEQNQVALQLNSVNDQIQTAELSNGSGVADTHVLQAAALQPASKYRLPIEAGVLGLVIGLLGATAFVLIRRERDPCLRLRDDIARAAGAPVIVSLTAPSCGTASEWEELLDSRPGSTTNWDLRRVLHQMLSGGDQRVSVRVISFVGDLPALTTGPQLARDATVSGTSTALIPEPEGSPSLAPLCAALSGAQRTGGAVPLITEFEEGRNDTPRFLVSITVFDGVSVAAAPDKSLNMLSISPGFATADEISRLALEVADAGSALDFVAVVNPDPADTTSGQFADDRLRLLPSGAHAQAGGTGLVHFGSRTSTAAKSHERLSSWER